MNGKNTPQKPGEKEVRQWAGLAGLMAASVILPRLLRRAAPHLRRVSDKAGDSFTGRIVRLRERFSKKAWRSIERGKPNGDL